MPVAAPAPTSASTTQTRGRMVNIPDWTNIKLRKEEEALGFQETGDPGVGMALLISAPALLRHDPERPEEGSSAELLDLPAEMLQSVQTYIDQRLKT